jgi:hypothetical protein
LLADVVLDSEADVSQGSKMKKNPGFLSSATLHISNLVFKNLVPDDPALIVQLGSKASIHAALALPSSPIAPGHNQMASVTHFRNWIIACAHVDPRITPARRVQGPRSLAWHHLTHDEHSALYFHRWTVPGWLDQIRAANYPEAVATVLIAVAEGRGSLNLFEAAVFD